MDDLEALSEEDLISSFLKAVGDESRSLVRVIRHLAEIDRRKVWLPRAFPSLFIYCTREFGYSEDEAAKRIQAARAARKFPLIYQLLEQRQIHLTAVVRLAPYLKEENFRDLLWSAAGRSKLEIECMIAALNPQAPQRD